MRTDLRRYLTGICAVLISSGALAQVKIAPKIELSEPEWNFGTVWYNTPLKHDVMVTNTGTAPLRITRIKTSCGCTASKLDQTEIAPGESVPMTVTYDSTKLRQRVGTTVTITSNDPAKPVTIYRIKGEVKPCYTMDPVGGVTFGQVMRKSTETRTVKIQNVFEEKMFLKLEDFKNEAYTLELREIEPGMRYELIASTKPPLKAGNSRAVAVLTSNLERVPEIKVPIRSYVVPRVSVTPRTIYIPKVYKKASEKSLLVRFVADNPIEITGVTSSHPGVSARILPAIKNARLGFSSREIRVSLPPGVDIPDEDTYLIITTDADEPEFAELKVTITNGARRRATAAAANLARQKALPRPVQILQPQPGAKPIPPKKGDGAK